MKKFEKCKFKKGDIVSIYSPNSKVFASGDLSGKQFTVIGYYWLNDELMIEGTVIIQQRIVVIHLPALMLERG